jgi:hypothetical protein
VAFTGKVVALVGVTLAAGVVTWAWSPIKFQADMGILLTFMFLWNMLGALILIPALSHFLLRGETSPLTSAGRDATDASAQAEPAVAEAQPVHEAATSGLTPGPQRGGQLAQVYP